MSFSGSIGRLAHSTRQEARGLQPDKTSGQLALQAMPRRFHLRPGDMLVGVCKLIRRIAGSIRVPRGCIKRARYGPERPRLVAPECQHMQS